MARLCEHNKDVHDQFVRGNFTAKKSKSAFASIAYDQAHEQLNKVIKGEGGIIALTENERASSQLLITAPEVARLISEFESEKYNADSGKLHHEQTPSTQTAFLSEVKLLLNAIDRMGNPFDDDSGQLLTLHTKDVAAGTAASVHCLYDIGKAQYDSFVKERLCDRSLSFLHPLKRNKLAPFSVKRTQVSSAKNKISIMKADCALFSRLYIGCQTREGDLDEFFQHENQSFPPSLSLNGLLHFGAKSDLLQCLEKLAAAVDAVDISSAAYIIDGAAVVQMLKPGSARTFSEYAETVFGPFVQAHLSQVKRLDVVWDRYDSNSLKATARGHRGTGVRRHVTASTPIPKNWQAFLSVSMNKTEIFKYLSDFLSHMSAEDGKQIFVTNGEAVLSVPDNLYHHGLSPCSHEEADTPLILHAYHAALNGFRSIVIKSVDTDVAVLAIASYSKIGCGELWLAFGTGQHFRYIPVHKIVEVLGTERCAALPAFHAITGCDTTSSFVGRGKKSAWKTWHSFPEATTAFSELSAVPSEVSEKCLCLLERFVILLYDRSSSSVSVNMVRKQLFSRKNRSLDNIPPTRLRDALLQHVKRASYQAGHVWGQSFIADPYLPSPSDWGWELVDSLWKPVWMTLPQAAQCCPELVRCGCKSGCTTRHCKCVRACLHCTSLCACDGECDGDDGNESVL